MPPEVVSVLNAAVNATLKRLDVQQKLAASDAELAGVMQQESAQWGRIVRTTGVRLD